MPVGEQVLTGKGWERFLRDWELQRQRGGKLVWAEGAFRPRLTWQRLCQNEGTQCTVCLAWELAAQWKGIGLVHQVPQSLLGAASERARALLRRWRDPEGAISWSLSADPAAPGGAMEWWGSIREAPGPLLSWAGRPFVTFLGESPHHSQNPSDSSISWTHPFSLP